jgi:hypothetical protein
MKKTNFLAYLVPIALTLMVALPAYSQDAKQPPDPSAKDVLEQIRKDARKDFQLTAKTLRAMNIAAMNDEDRATYVRLSREAAVRIGDRDWQSSLKDEKDPFSLVSLYQILLASGYLNEGDFAAAHAQLNQIKNFEQVNTRDKRRYWAIKARLAELEGNIVEERQAIEKIVHELAHWPSKDCQSCHDDPKLKDNLPLLDVQNFWFGKRFVDLMKIQGDAQKIQRAAEKDLAADPRDNDARIRLSYALQALGRTEDAERRLKEIPWVAFPDRSGSEPRMMVAWP